MLDQSRPFRCYRLNFYPYRLHTMALLTCTDWRGRTEHDRRVNTWDLMVPADELKATDEQTALLYLLRELLDKMDPPEGSPWAEPPESPEGDYRGEMLPGNWDPSLSGGAATI